METGSLIEVPDPPGPANTTVGGHTKDTRPAPAPALSGDTQAFSEQVLESSHKSEPKGILKKGLEAESAPRKVSKFKAARMQERAAQNK